MISESAQWNGLVLLIMAIEKLATRFSLVTFRCDVIVASIKWPLACRNLIDNDAK